MWLPWQHPLPLDWRSNVISTVRRCHLSTVNTAVAALAAVRVRQAWRERMKPESLKRGKYTVRRVYGAGRESVCVRARAEATPGAGSVGVFLDSGFGEWQELIPGAERHGGPGGIPQRTHTHTHTEINSPAASPPRSRFRSPQWPATGLQHITIESSQTHHGVARAWFLPVGHKTTSCRFVDFNHRCVIDLKAAVHGGFVMKQQGKSLLSSLTMRRVV